MVHNHDIYISAINIFLIILSMLGIILTATLSFIIPEVLGFTRTHYATCSVLVAGLVSFPASIKIKFNEDSPILAKLYGHTSSFRNLTVAISLGLNGIAIIVCLFTLITNKDFTHDFFQLMKFYNSKHSSKLVVNEIQGTLQCCGSHCYKDWFRVNWKGFENQDQWSDNCEEEEEDNGIDVSSVPYSCCKTRAPTSCRHYDLRMFSTITINEQGCAKRIRLRTLYYLWFLLAISLMSVFCEIWVLVLTSRNSGHGAPTTTQTELAPTTSTTTQSSKAKVKSKKPSKKSTKSPKSAENQDYTVSYSALLHDTAWETYSKATAEIEPSSHSELIFVAHQDFSYDET